MDDDRSTERPEAGAAEPGAVGEKKPKRRLSPARDLGSLNKMLIRGLPAWVDETGALCTYTLAEHLGISYQALYSIYQRNRIPPKRIAALVKLSNETPQDVIDKITAAGGTFTPLSADSFMDFL